MFEGLLGSGTRDAVCQLWCVLMQNIIQPLAAVSESECVFSSSCEKGPLLLRLSGDEQQSDKEALCRFSSETQSVRAVYTESLSDRLPCCLVDG